jgi:hypothetical protein
MAEDIDTWPQPLTLVVLGDRATIIVEKEMFPTTPCPYLNCIGQGTQLLLSLAKTFETPVAGVHIKDQQTWVGTHRDANVGMGVICKPLGNLSKVGGCVLNAVPRLWMFAWIAAVGAPGACAMAISYSMNGNDRPTLLYQPNCASTISR